MIILEAVIHETVWGGNRLNTCRRYTGTDISNRETKLGDGGVRAIPAYDCAG